MLKTKMIAEVTGFSWEPLQNLMLLPESLPRNLYYEFSLDQMQELSLLQRIIL